MSIRTLRLNAPPMSAHPAPRATRAIRAETAGSSGLDLGPNQRGKAGGEVEASIPVMAIATAAPDEGFAWRTHPPRRGSIVPCVCRSRDARERAQPAFSLDDQPHISAALRHPRLSKRSGAPAFRIDPRALGSQDDRDSFVRARRG